MGEMGNVAYLTSVMIMCLLVAALFGAVLTYFWRRFSYRRMYANSEQSWLSRLRQTEQDRDSRIARLTSEVEEFRHQVPTMERSLLERSDIINALETTVESHKTVVKSLEQKLKDAMGGVESSNDNQQKMTKLEGELEVSRYETGNLNRELEQLRTKHNEANARAVSAKEELDRLSNANQQQQTLFDEQKGSVDQFKGKLDDSEKRVAGLKQELSSLSSRYSRLEQEHLSAQAQLKGAASKIKEVKSASAEFGSREQELTSLLNEQGKELDTVRDEAEQATRKLQLMREEVELAEALKQQLHAQRESAEESASRLAKVELAKNELEQTIRERTEAHSKVEHNYSELRAKFSELESVNAQRNAQQQSLNGELGEAKESAREAGEELSRWRSQAQKLENTLQTHELNAKESQRQAEHWQSEHDKLKAHSANQAALTEEARRDVQKLRHELTEARRESQAGRDKQVDLQKRLEDRERTMSAEIRQYKTTIGEFERSQAGVNQAAEENAMLRRTLEQRDAEFTREHQECSKQRELAGDWKTRFDELKIEHERVLALPAPASGKKAKVIKQASAELLEKPDWLLDEAPDEKDNLKKIWGVGPVMEKTMNGLGIYLFRQVAALRKKDIEWVASHINTFPGRIERDDWAGQAAKLRKEKYGR